MCECNFQIFFYISINDLKKFDNYKIGNSDTKFKKLMLFTVTIGGLLVKAVVAIKAATAVHAATVTTTAIAAKTGAATAVAAKTGAVAATTKAGVTLPWVGWPGPPPCPPPLPCPLPH